MCVEFRNIIRIYIPMEREGMCLELKVSRIGDMSEFLWSLVNSKRVRGVLQGGF